MAKKGTSHLSCWTKQFGGGEEVGEEEKKEKEKEGKR